MTGSRALSLERAVRHQGLVVLEAPVGFDGPGFVDDLINRMDGIVIELDDPDDVDANLVPDHAWISAPLSAGLRGWRDTVVRRFRDGKSTVVSLPVGVSGDGLIDEPVPTLLIDGTALLMSGADVLALAAEDGHADSIDPAMADLIVELGGGWPAWVHGCLSLLSDRGVQADQLIASIAVPTFRRRLVARYLTGFEPKRRHDLAQLAHFEAFSDAAASAVGGVEFADSLLPHAPGLLRTPTGLLTFVQPVRLELIGEFKLEPSVAESLAPVLVADGQLLAACQALLDSGLDDQVARLLEALPGRVLDMTNQRELLAIFRLLSGHLDSYPGVALKQARAHANLAEVPACIEYCEMVLGNEGAGPLLKAEASIELLLYRYRSIAQTEAKKEVERLECLVGVSGPLPTRLREVEAQVLGQSSSNHDVQAAADRLVEVASEWEFQQERLRAARTLRVAAAGPLWHLGQYREGQRLLQRAARLAIAQPFDYGITLGLKAKFDAMAGDLEAFRRSIEQARFVVEESGIGWLDAYLHWAAAFASGYEGSIAGVQRSFRIAKQKLGPLFESDTGVVLCAEIAIQAALLGDVIYALRCLNEVRARKSQNGMEFDYAEIIVLARGGERERAWQTWEELEAADIVPNDRRWRVELELALADRCAGVQSKIDLESVEREAQRLEMSSVLPTIAPDIFSRTDSTVGAVRLEVFGGLRAHGSEGEIQLPEGRVSELLKVLIILDGRAVVDVVVEHLWPEAELKVGLRRLKNVVTKTRNVLGQDSIVRDQDSIRLGDRIRTDLAEFTEMSTTSSARRSVDNPGARRAAIAALDLYHGPLLPADIYGDRVNERRYELQLKAESLLEFVLSESRPHAAWMASTMSRLHAQAAETH